MVSSQVQKLISIEFAALPRFVFHLLSSSPVGLTAYGATANGGDLSASFAQYSTLFQEQLFVHVMSLDFVALWLLSPWVSIIAFGINSLLVDSAK